MQRTVLVDQHETCPSKLDSFPQKHAGVRVNSQKPHSISSKWAVIFPGPGGYRWSFWKDRSLGCRPAHSFVAMKGLMRAGKAVGAKVLPCCLLSGRLCAYGISECFWAKLWRFSFPRARDLFTWCWEHVQVSALPWHIRCTPKEEYYIKMRRQLESLKWTTAESELTGFPVRSTVGALLVCWGRGEEIKDKAV